MCFGVGNADREHIAIITLVDEIRALDARCAVDEADNSTGTTPVIAHERVAYEALVGVGGGSIESVSRAIAHNEVTPEHLLAHNTTRLPLGATVSTELAEGTALVYYRTESIVTDGPIGAQLRSRLPSAVDTSPLAPDVELTSANVRRAHAQDTPTPTAEPLSTLVDAAVPEFTVASSGHDVPHGAVPIQLHDSIGSRESVTDAPALSTSSSAELASLARQATVMEVVATACKRPMRNLSPKRANEQHLRQQSKLLLSTVLGMPIEQVTSTVVSQLSTRC